MPYNLNKKDMTIMMVDASSVDGCFFLVLGLVKGGFGRFRLRRGGPKGLLTSPNPGCFLVLFSGVLL